jgi:hypothetical protein
MDVGTAHKLSRKRSEVMIALSGSACDWTRKALSSWPCVTTSIGDLEAGRADISLSSAAILFVPELDASRRLISSLVRRIRAEHPGLHISVCTSDPSRLDWPALARAGVDDVTLLFGDAEVEGLTRWVEDRLSLPVPEDAIQDLVQAFGHDASTTIAAWCFRNATRPRPVAAIGYWFGISSRTVRRRLNQAQLPQADVLLRCGRVLHALELERTGMKPRVRIANRLGFSAAHDLWRAKAAIRDECVVDSRLAALVRKVRALWYLFPDGVA